MNKILFKKILIICLCLFGVVKSFNAFCAANISRDYYVDATYGDDAYDGLSSATAKKTLAAVMRTVGELSLTEGVVVHAASGDYDAGEMWDGATSNRVIIPPHVGLVSDFGRDLTRIIGAADRVSESAVSGCGPAAVRCVRLGEKSWIRGFTLINGYTAINATGGGVQVPPNDVQNAAIVDCAILDCHANKNFNAVDGGSQALSVIRCEIRKNDLATYDVGNCAALVDTVIKRKDARQWTIFNNGCILNCTLSAGVYNDIVRPIINTLLVWDLGRGAYTNCVLTTQTLQTNSNEFNTRHISIGSFNDIFDDNLQPKRSAAVLIDQADKSLYDAYFPRAWLRFKDLTDWVGGVRLQGAALDIGAGEYQVSASSTKRLGTIFSLHGSRPMGVSPIALVGAANECAAIATALSTAGYDDAAWEICSAGVTVSDYPGRTALVFVAGPDGVIPSTSLWTTQAQLASVRSFTAGGGRIVMDAAAARQFAAVSWAARTFVYSPAVTILEASLAEVQNFYSANGAALENAEGLTDAGRRVAALAAAYVAGVRGKIEESEEPESGDYFTIASRGAKPRYPIVLPVGATASEREAARELRETVTRMTGVLLTIQEGVGPIAGIYLSGTQDARYGESGFRLACDGTRLRVEGGCRGVLYGVYELLERFGDCGWYTSWHSVIPTCDRFAVPKNLDETQMPAFEVRNTSNYDKDIAFAAHSRLNGDKQGFDVAHGGACRFSFATDLESCHTMHKIVKPSKYGNDHPEYFAQIDGVRQPFKDGGTQLCLSNPEVLQLAIDFVLKRAQESPNIRNLGVSQSDNQNYCQCAQCVAAYEKYGEPYEPEPGESAESIAKNKKARWRPSGLNLEFINAIADELAKVRPDAYVETLAYQYSRRPPYANKIVPRKNVMICFCSIESEFGKGLAESDYENNCNFAEDISIWRDISSRIFVWDYTVNFNDFQFPFLNFKAIKPNVQFFCQKGVDHLYEQGYGLGYAGWYCDLRVYLMSKLMWNPDADISALTTRFINNHYGPAAPYVTKDFAAFNNLTVGGANDPVTITESIDKARYSDALFTESVARWTAATEAVKEASPEIKRAVEYGRFSADYATARRFYKRLNDSSPIVVDCASERYADFKVALACAQRVDAVLQTDSLIRLSEGDSRNTANIDAIHAFANYTLSDEFTGPCYITADQFKLEAANRGTFVSDVADSTSGTVIEISPKVLYTSHKLLAKRLLLDSGQKYSVSVRLRAWDVPATDYQGSRHNSCNYVAWCILYNKSGTKIAQKQLFREEVYGKEGFQIYKLFDWTPEFGDYINFYNSYNTDIAKQNPAYSKLQFDCFILEPIK